MKRQAMEIEEAVLLPTGPMKKLCHAEEQLRVIPEAALDDSFKKGQGLVRVALDLLETRKSLQGPWRVRIVLKGFPVFRFPSFQVPLGDEDGSQVGVVERGGGLGSRARGPGAPGGRA